MTLKVESSIIPYKGGIEVASYLVDEAKEYRAKSIPGYILLEFFNLQKRQTENYSLSFLETTIRPISLFVSPNPSRSEKIDCNIMREVNDQQQEIFGFDLNRVEIPYIFPDIILTPENTLKITPTFDIDKMFIVCEPAQVLLHHVFTPSTAN